MESYPDTILWGQKYLKKFFILKSRSEADTVEVQSKIVHPTGPQRPCLRAVFVVQLVERSLPTLEVRIQSLANFINYQLY